MALSCAVRRVGDVGVVRCSGRVVRGGESAALLQVIEDLLPQTQRVVLQMAGVDFIDSSGLGLLIRLLRRIQTAGGRLTLCELASRVALALSTTHMESIFEIHQFEDDAIAALHKPLPSDGGSFEFVYANVLCAADSADLLSYVSELLRHAGYAVLAANNAADAVTLLKLLARPKLVVTTPAFRAAANAAFASLLAAAAVVELSPEFSTADVDASAEALFASVRAAIGAPRPAGPQSHHA